MTSSELIPAAVLKRKAVVYVRQSTQSQVMTNLESQRRQYDLVDLARQRGFVDVEIIDDDLGRSASGTVARPGFDRGRMALRRQGRRSFMLRRVAARPQRSGLASLARIVRACRRPRHRSRRRLQSLPAQ